ncbi:MAG: EAL domain-containing protein [Alphaproteobacteria bacterium]
MTIDLPSRSRDRDARVVGEPSGDRLFSAVVDSAPDGVVVVDAAGTVLAFSRAAAALLHHDAAAVVGTSIVDLLSLPEDGLAGFLGACLHGCVAAETCRHLVALRRGDEETAVVEVAVSRVQLPDGPGHVAILRDMGLHLGEGWDDDEARLGSIASNVPGIVFQRVRQPDGTVYYPFFSSGVRDVLGFEPEAMRVNRDGCLDVIHWADRDDHLAAIRASARDLSPCTENFRAIARSGEVRWLHGNSRPQRMADGDVIWDGVLVDVTERKRAEQRLEMIMDHAYDGIVTIDETGRMQSVNAATGALFGYGEAEMIGRSVSMLMPEPHRLHHDDYIARYVETGESRMVGVGPRELEGQRRDGSRFPLEVALSEVRSEGRRVFIGIMRDITRRKAIEAALRETEQRLGGIAANLPGMVFQRLMTPEGVVRFTYVSDGCRELLGVEPFDLIDDVNLFLRILSDQDQAVFLDQLFTSAAALTPLEDEVRVIAPDGRERWLRGWSRPRRLENGDVIWDGVTLDVTDRREAEEKVRFLAYFDPVTGAPNRALFREQFPAAAQDALRLDHHLAVVSLGIDRFSIINASMGHAVGDEVLATVANRLRARAGAGDIVARAGGDRFLVLLTGLMSEGQATEAVESLLAGFAESLILEGQELDLTVCAGVSLHPRDGTDAETLIKNADTALHRAKTQGPGSLQLFTAEMSARAARTLSMQSRLRHALDDGQFVAYYQPQVDLRSGRTVGLEALVRWIDPERGLVSPAEFIPIAEESGLIDDICDHVLHYSARSISRWRAEGLDVVPVAVNVSGRQFQHARRLMLSLEQVLRENQLDPSLIEIELTESSAMSDPDNAIAVVNTLRDMGIRCAIDDFGTGYSSLGVLKRFPISKLKVDRSFVIDVISDPNDAAIVSAIIAMSHALKMRVVAEGVEEMTHYEFLKTLGCDQIQGYLISRPLPHDALSRFFREGPWKPASGA